MKKYLLPVLLVAVFLGVIIYSTNKVESPKNVIRFGAVISQSSYAAEDGEEVKSGLELAKSDLAKEGIDVSIEYYDDSTDPKKVATGIQYMRSKNINVIFGPIWSFLADAAVGVAKDSDVTLLGPSMTSELLSSPSNKMLFGQIKNEHKRVPLEEWMKANNIKKPAILISQNNWGVNHTDIFTRATKNVGGTVVMSDALGFGQEAESLPALILKAKMSGADAILWAGSNDGEVIFVREMSKLGMNIPLFTDEEVLTAVRKNMISVNSPIKIYTWERPVSKEFAEKYKAYYGKLPNHYADSSYDMMMVTARAINSSNGENLKDAINSLNYTGSTGLYTLDEKGDRVGGSWHVIQVTK